MRFVATTRPQAPLLLKDYTPGSTQLDKHLAVYLILMEGTEMGIPIICPLTDS